MTGTRIWFKIPKKLIEPWIEKNRDPFGLDRPNYRTDDAIRVSACPPQLKPVFEDLAARMLGILPSRINTGRVSDIMLARFGCVGLHTDERFPQYCLVIPLIGSGDLRVAPGENRVETYPIDHRVGVVFDNHLPHDFMLRSRSPMVAVLVSIHGLSSGEIENIRRVTSQITHEGQARQL